ncbi:MAG: hypothetical protein PHO44_07770 [Sphaerochaetaceae bacterium]|nr:hypothetical protein [Sphaerochaetaceae bacterium]MDD3163925.1 hypothetical protein [Sphaerochaetaceae bacterium]MDD4007865.1 hypothetical protein [Sphaerochaetaceae bacterium]MDD4397063.1 hypothetical protein [Sphaerochaetaceae bacterium]
MIKKMKLSMFAAVFFFVAMSLSAMTAVQDPDSLWYPDRVVIDHECTEAELNSIRYIMVSVNGVESDLISPYEQSVTIGGTDAPLWPESDYTVLLEGFDGKDAKVSEVSCSARTGSWAGDYKWVNPTDDNNKGRCKSIYVTAVLSNDKTQGGPYYDLYDIQSVSGKDQELRFFPIDGIRDSYSYHDYDEASDLGVVYRSNASKFNKTSLTPAKWIISEMVVTAARYRSSVNSKAFMFTVNTTTDYWFRINEDSNQRELVFVLDGDGLCKTGMFFNPAPPAEGKAYYVLSEVKASN